MYKFFLLIAVVCFIGCGKTKYKDPHIIIYTSYGDIEAELYPDKAPKTVAAILQYIDSGIYNNSSFYRVLYYEGASTSSNTGVIQGGTWPSDNKQYSFVQYIPHESTKTSGLTHVDGTLSLARTDTGTAGTEFFICIGAQTQFDHGGNTPPDGQGFAAFGKVIKGMSIVRKIQEQPKAGEDGFREKIRINKIEKL